MQTSNPPPIGLHHFCLSPQIAIAYLTTSPKPCFLTLRWGVVPSTVKGGIFHDSRKDVPVESW